MDEDVGHALRILVANFSKIASEVVRGMAMFSEHALTEIGCMAHKFCVG